MNGRRGSLVMGIALAALLTMDTTDDELRRRRKREAREPRPVPIPDPEAMLASDPIGRALVDARARSCSSMRARRSPYSRSLIGIVGMLPGHPPEVQAMIDAEERRHRAIIEARNARATPRARATLTDTRPTHTRWSRVAGQSTDDARATLDAAQAKRERKAAKRLKEQGT